MSVADTTAGKRERLSHLRPGRIRTRHRAGYSQFVRAMRLGLPVVAALVIGSAFLWPQFKGDLARLINFLPFIIDTAAEDFQMVKLSLRGVDRHDRPYVFTAETAAKFDPDVDEVALDVPNADVVLSEGAWLAIMSDRGFYRPDNRILEFIENVNVFHDDGYEFSTSSVVLDFGEGIAYGDEPITGHGAFGTLDGSGFRIGEDGNKLILHGPAHVRIY